MVGNLQQVETRKFFLNSGRMSKKPWQQHDLLRFKINSWASNGSFIIWNILGSAQRQKIHCRA